MDMLDLVGTTSSKDTCTLLTSGLYQDALKSIWVPHWGDGKRAGSEEWDDHNTSNTKIVI